MTFIKLCDIYHSAENFSAPGASLQPPALPSRGSFTRRGICQTAHMRILLVEDHQDIAENICEFLATKGHQVSHVLTGEDGLNQARATPFDIIVLDVMLPGMDGLAVCRALRSEIRAVAPVLMLTAKDLVVDKVAGFEAGADDYLVKPFSLLELEARLGALARRAVPRTTEGVLRVADLSYCPDTLIA